MMFVLSSSNKLINKECNFINVLLSLKFKDDRMKEIRFKRLNLSISNNYVENIDIRGLNDSVCNIYIKCNEIENYEILSELERKLWQIKFAFKGLEEYFRLRELENTSLIELKNELISSLEDIAISMFRKPIFNKGKSISAMVFLQPELNKNVFYVKFYNQNKDLVYKEIFFEGYPIFLYWKRMFAKFEWVDNHDFTITDSKGEFSFIFEVIKRNMNLNYHVNAERKILVESFINSWHFSSEKPNFDYLV